MKTVLLALAFTITGNFVHSQNINDHKISFNYIQLPLMKIDPQFNQYSVIVTHDYEQANRDSTALFAIRQEAAMAVFQENLAQYYREHDSLTRMHLMNLSDWEQKVNSGVKNSVGAALPEPVPPIFPTPPEFPRIEAPILHSAYTNEEVSQRINLDGYEIGEGQVEVTISIQPIRNIRIISSTKGTGASMKYDYTAKYILPIGLKVNSPTQGILMETTLFESEMTYNMRDQKSKYDHELYMMDNKETFIRELEVYARTQALSRANDHLNDNFGFVERTRVAEIYSVKSFKDYDYTDVTNAFTKITFAFQEVGADRSRAGAMDEIQAAMNAIKGILEDSNLSDNKSRINDKITAMLHCNLAELYVWQGEFNKADATVNLIMNSGEGKAKRHIDDETGFYSNQRKRWEVHY